MNELFYIYNNFRYSTGHECHYQGAKHSTWTYEGGGDGSQTEQMITALV